MKAPPASAIQSPAPAYLPGTKYWCISSVAPYTLARAAAKKAAPTPVMRAASAYHITAQKRQ
jgi:hypothetical protein